MLSTPEKNEEENIIIIKTSINNSLTRINIYIEKIFMSIIIQFNKQNQIHQTLNIKLIIK